MAAPDPSDKIKGKEYTNWLKVTLALYYMKSGLHTFIQNEVDFLHQSLVQKIYGGQTVPLPPCTMCHASHIIRNKYSGVWTFQKQCKSYCDVWLHELLKLHTNPKSEKIYWDNSNIPSWPFKSWECAKVFMPRGQAPSNVGPTECDSQALLTLLSSCTHFHNKHSLHGRNLLPAISSIRNKVMHDGEMKLSDGDRMNFIKQFIQLLEDPVSLKSLEDCKTAVSNIHKIDTDSVDIFFNVHQEMTALRLLVNELRLEHGIQENKIIVDSVDSLKEEYRQLREQHTKRFEDAEKELELHEKRLGTVEENVNLNRERLDTVEENVELQQKGLDELRETIGKMQVKLGQSTRENNSCMKEPLFARRPENDGLKQLKNQTEDRLDTHRRLECIPTKQAEEAKKVLEEKRSIVIKGNAGEGKTTIALYLIDNEIYRDRRVMLFSPTHYEKVDTDWVDIVILEDIFGQYDLDPGRLQEWMVYLPSMQEHVDAGKLRVIITTRLDILSKAYSRIDSLKFFSNDLSLTLSSEQLNNSEKMSILNKELLRHKRNMKEDEKQKCISNFSGLIGFPQCCSLFAGDSNLFDRGSDFFRYSAKLFVANISALEATQFLSLAFLFCNGEIPEEYLTPETMPKDSQHLLKKLASNLHISDASITIMRDAYDDFVELYVVKSMSPSFGGKPCIRFTHSTVLEAVGQVLGDRCLQMVVKYGDSEYLYQRTYTAEAKDPSSQNMFIPLSVYGLLAKRMVDDVANEDIASCVVKHSALKRCAFLVKLKDELQKGNMIEDFFTSGPCSMSTFGPDLSEGECITFMQYILQNDEDVVSLVYSHLLEFLACAHNNISSDCWKCKEKQNLLELALYYHHFEIADKLIAMKACYTYESIINAARHGDLRRVQDITDTLKRSRVFNSGCMEGKYALCRAFISGSQNLTEFLLKEGIVLNSWHVVDVVQHGDVDVLMKVVEHLKSHNKWNPHQGQDGAPRHLFISGMHLGNCKHFKFEIPCFTALKVTYCHEKFDMTDYLLKNEVKLSLYMLSYVSHCSSQQAVARVIQDLKVANSWDPHCDDASKILENVYALKKYDVCDLLVQEGITLTMKNLLGVVDSEWLESVEKAIEHLKYTNNWDPKCDAASKALETALRKKKNDVCDLLVREGVSLTMKHIHHVVLRSLDYIKKAVKCLKDADNWDPKCDDASEALKTAYMSQKNDICELLVQEGVLLTMKNLPSIVYSVSLKSVEKAIQHLKDTANWDPKCDDASKALENAFRNQKYGMYDLLVQEGVSLTMNNLPGLVGTFMTYRFVEKAIRNLKDIHSWNPKCAYASIALENAYREQNFDVYELLIQEGVSITMKNFPGVVTYRVILETVEHAMQHLKDTDNWDPRCEDASQALETAYNQEKYDVCARLVKEKVSMRMKHNHQLLLRSHNNVKTALNLLKAINKWDPRCDDASEALKNAYRNQDYDVCNQLVQEGVSLTMEHLPGVVCSVSVVKNAIKHLQDTKRWDPTCDEASKALETAYILHNYDVCALLVQHGVSLTIKQFTVVKPFTQLTDAIDCESLQQILQNLCLETVVKYGDSEFLYQMTYTAETKDGTSQNMFLPASVYGPLVERLVDDIVNERLVRSVVKYSAFKQHDFVMQLKDELQKGNRIMDFFRAEPHHNEFSEFAYDLSKGECCTFMQCILQSDADVVGLLYNQFLEFLECVCNNNIPKCWKCEEKQNLLELSLYYKHFDIADKLITMKACYTLVSLCNAARHDDIGRVQTILETLKSSQVFKRGCKEGKDALCRAFMSGNQTLIEFLLNEGIILNMWHVVDAVQHGDVDVLMKVVEHLKSHNKWNPHQGQDGAPRHLFISGMHLGNCEHFKFEIPCFTALQVTYCNEKFDMTDYLLKNEIKLSLYMLSYVSHCSSQQAVARVIQDLKVANSWDPHCDDASKILENVYALKKYDVCDLLVQEGITLTMKNLLGVVDSEWLESVEKAIEHLKYTNSWDPKCDAASKALETAFRKKKNDVCDLLVREGVSLTMKHIHQAVTIGLDYVETVVKELKVNGNWDPKCDDASEALKTAYMSQKNDIWELLVQEGVLLKMKNVPSMVYCVSLKSVEKAIQHLKDTASWDPECDDASQALENAYKKFKYDVCDLLVQEGVSLTMNNLPGVVHSVSLKLEAFEKTIQHLKDTGSWDPKCDDASQALENACEKRKYDVCDLLVQEGVSLTMKHFPRVVVYNISFAAVLKLIQHLKDTSKWDPKCDDASEALIHAYGNQEYDVCDLLVQEGVSLTMKNLSGMLYSVSVVKKVIQHLKDTKRWNPRCSDASRLLECAYIVDTSGVCALLTHEGVSLTMKNLPGLVHSASVQSVEKAIQHLKDTHKWNPKTDYASEALENAYHDLKHDVCDLLVQEGVSLNTEASYRRGIHCICC